MKINKILEKKIDLLCGEPAREQDVEKAEKKLGLHFAEEYKEYLLEYGIVAYSGHEITGLVDDDRTNVVTTTQRNKKGRKNIPRNLYVIEETNMDGIVIWQSTDGKIYSTVNDGKPEFLYASLAIFFSKR